MMPDAPLPTEDELNPQPPLWPACDKCETPYVLRRGLSFTQGAWAWAWQRDCAKPRSTCKGAGAHLAGPDGRYEPGGAQG